MCDKLFSKDKVKKIVDLLENRGYILENELNISSTQIENLNNCIFKLLDKYNISSRLTNSFNSLAENCENQGYIYIYFDTEKFNVNEAKNIIKEYCKTTLNKGEN